MDGTGKARRLRYRHLRRWIRGAVHRWTPGGRVWSRAAGPYVLSEPELQAELQAAALAGRLRCALCGQPLQVAEAVPVRRRLAHRWATRAAHAHCARGHHGGWEGPATPPTRALSERSAGRQGSPPASSTADIPLALIGQLQGRVPMALLVLNCRDALTAVAALGRLATGASAVEDFDPRWGAHVRAVHSLYPEVCVYLGSGLTITWADGPDGPVWVRRADDCLTAAARAGSAETFQAAIQAGVLVLVQQAPDLEPVGAVLIP